MKLRVLDRIISAIIGLLLLGAAAAVCAELIWNVPVSQYVLSWLHAQGSRRQLFIIIAAAVVALLGLYSLCTLFRRPKKDRNYISQKTDEGELSISYAAIDSLVQRCLSCQSELSVTHTKITSGRDGLTILLKGTVGTGVNMPLVISSVQREVRQYVTSCSGLEVQEVRVKVDATDASRAGGAYAIADPQPLPGTQESAKAAPRDEPVFTAPAMPAAPAVPAAPAEPEPPAAAEEPARPAIDMNQVLSELDAEDALKAAERAEQAKESVEDGEEEAHHQRIFGHMEEPVIGPDPAPGQTAESVESAESADPEDDDESAESADVDDADVLAESADAAEGGEEGPAEPAADTEAVLEEAQAPEDAESAPADGTERRGEAE